MENLALWLAILTYASKFFQTNALSMIFTCLNSTKLIQIIIVEPFMPIKVLVVFVGQNFGFSTHANPKTDTAENSSPTFLPAT